MAPALQGHWVSYGRCDGIVRPQARGDGGVYLDVKEPLIENTGGVPLR